MPFTLSDDVLVRLFKCANFEIPSDPLIFAGLRGCVPLTPHNSAFSAGHQLELLGVDYTHPRCTVVQWSPGRGLAVYPGSTVPHRSAVQSHLPAGGVGVNELTTGFYRDNHRYRRGDHSLSNANRRHRAFRNDSPLPVRRTADDLQFEGSDALSFGVVNDNIHCAWQQDHAAPNFSSNGCQVVIGRPRVASRGWASELGPWAAFLEAGYDADQEQFCYALFSGREVVAAATAAAGTRPQTVRFGSEGALVARVQAALLERGIDVGSAGADGDLGWKTLMGIRQLQLDTFGSDGVDLVVGPTTAAALGIPWASEADGEASIGPASLAGAGRSTEAGPAYRSLSSGFFSSSPFDLSVKRSIRTNNPGALNVTQWQRRFPGFSTVTQPDSAGNVTSIYWTPEHGIAAWHHLMTDRYGYGSAGRFSLRELAMRYAGVQEPDHAAVKSYLAGWRRRSGHDINGTSMFGLDSDDDMLILARGMFGHECAGASPIQDEQVVFALGLKRTGNLPPY